MHQESGYDDKMKIVDVYRQKFVSVPGMQFFSVTKPTAHAPTGNRTRDKALARLYYTT